ncbi:DOMON-like domain-containing protein [Aromatoleum toluclasticum]|uniref:DOMON-like domain-containing protein n=1 Tax=Aromatoleum toluclasticum TaxID=92003 RepID=UPI000372C961|nr:DOMON-like domain-containing protein [Aromatoleum toluclasticum]
MTAAATAQLRPYPASPPGPIDSIAATIAREDRDSLRLRFELVGNLRQVAVPSRRAARMADGLWAHTCCEAFIGIPGSPAYREFNFSPSGEWAIYDFDDYRIRRHDECAVPAPRISVTHEAGRLILEASIDAKAVTHGSPLQFGLTTVVEALDGTLSYWALRHPGARPDFHLRDAFTLTLP